MGAGVAGFIGILSFVVGVALVTTIVKNGSGSAQVIDSAARGFGAILSAAQGNPVYG